MGQTKALMEKVMVAKGRNLTQGETVFSLTRYGNVMLSRGSIIPLIISQIKTGTDITITDPSMTRFLMSLDESVSLVLHAFEQGSQGDIFIHKAPASTIKDLVQALIEIFDAKNSIKIIGTRHGEKLYESLVSREEMAKAEESDNYFRIPVDARDLNYSSYYTDGDEKISEIEDYNSHNTIQLNVEEVKEVLLKLDYVRDSLSE